MHITQTQLRGNISLLICMTQMNIHDQSYTKAAPIVQSLYISLEHEFVYTIIIGGLVKCGKCFFFNDRIIDRLTE